MFEKNQLILEACVETFEQALNAEINGANRIELCGDLSVGGISPDFALIKKCKAHLSIPIMVMIRPRGGNFIYSAEEFNQMKAEIIFCKNLGIAGVVFGLLDLNNKINIEQVAELTQLAHPLEVTFHKAIDEVVNPIEELEKLIKIGGITRVLTSGKARTALEGSELIRNMIQSSNSQITILSAGKITAENLENVHLHINGKEYHGKKIVGDLF